MHKKRILSRLVFCLAATLAIMLAVQLSWAQVLPVQTPLPGGSITKYVEAMPHFAGNRVPGAHITMSAHEFPEKVLPSSFYTGLPAPFNNGTIVWGYKASTLTQSFGPNYPGFTIEATKGIPTAALYKNQLPLSPFLQTTVITDQTLHWANPLGLNMMDPLRMLPYLGPPPIAFHLHGAEVPSEFDGGPDSWFTPEGIKGAGYRSQLPFVKNGCVYVYPNSQEPATLWVHDHALGATRLNVYRGLAAAYLIRDWYDPRKNKRGLERPDLPGGPKDTTVKEPNRAIFTNIIYKPEIELAIQDRMFDTNGQLFFPHEGDNPDIHPFWLPEFFGDVMVVNGRSWPYLNVEPRRYRFRTLDGCNARFLNMWLRNDTTNTLGPVIWQIGTDGGLLNAPVMLDPAAGNNLFLAPGERADIIIDFKNFEGQTLTLHNDAAAPFPAGDLVDPDTTGQIMQFRVGTTLSKPIGPTGDPSYNPAEDGAPRMKPIMAIDINKATVERQLTLNEIPTPNGPLEILLNNTKWVGMRPDPMMGGMLMPIPGFVPDGQGNFLSELPKVGSTEIWTVINLTMDAHPIHVHLVQFRVINREEFNQADYMNVYNAAFPGGNYIPEYGPPKDYFSQNGDGAIGGNPEIGPHLSGVVIPPLPEEEGWKDTIKMLPGQVTRIAIRFAQQNGSSFPFDATGTKRFAFDRKNKLADGPGYVWHCHIVDHEDNEMMRPYKLRK